ncbi:MAG: hypothetical protein HY900_06360 [Deltaproteobacteria bacterium]|nr:hypothetical protein [Deltaproteobacteria bacterium]
MSAREPRLPETAPQRVDSFSGCLARLFWMAAGNVLLFFLAAGIFSKSPGALSGLDLGYWLVVAASLAVRYADIRYLGGRTANGVSATLRDWGRYAAILVGVALVVWGAAHLMG